MAIYQKIMYICLAFGILFGACNQYDLQQDSPEKAVAGFFKALEGDDFEQAEKYLTKRTQPNLHLYQSNLKMVGAEEAKKLKAQMVVANPTIECEEKLGQMTCSVCCNANEAKAEIKLIQENKKWFLEFVFVL